MQNMILNYEKKIKIISLGIKSTIEYFNFSCIQEKRSKWSDLEHVRGAIFHLQNKLEMDVVCWASFA